MDWTRDMSWRQGHVLLDATSQALNLQHATYPDETIVVVISHDCDLACSVDLEPTVEVVVGRRIAIPSGNATHAKTTRTLHLEWTHQGQQQIWVELLISHRQTLSKALLVGVDPDPAYELSLRDLAILQQWLANRYRRSAFPNEFEARLKEAKLHEKIANVVKPFADKIVGVFFDVDRGKQVERDGPDDVYILGITVLYYGTAPDPEGLAKAIETAFETIEKQFIKKFFDPDKEWKNIELLVIDVIADTAIKYADFVLLKRWQLDYMSLRADPPVQIEQT